MPTGCVGGAFASVVPPPPPPDGLSFLQPATHTTHRTLAISWLVFMAAHCIACRLSCALLSRFYFCGYGAGTARSLGSLCEGRAVAARPGGGSGGRRGAAPVAAHRRARQAGGARR